jgi:nitrogen fixation protein NifU and related proteins
MDQYSDKVMQTFKEMKNAGKIENADGIGKVGNPVCGDVMWIFIKVDDKEVITECKFQTFGCVAAIATSSLATELVIGKTLDEALQISNKRIVDLLGGLPKEKHHCSILAEEGIKNAIEDYRNKKKI